MSPIESFSTAIMPRPSRSTLTIPRSAQSSLSHCTTTRPGIVAGSSGTTRIKLALADHHAAGVLAQMPRQVLQPHTKIKIFRDALLREIKPAVVKCRSNVSFGPRHSKLPTMAERRLSVSVSKPKTLPTSRAARPSSIRDDVRRHGRAQLSITLIDILNRLLALIAAGQIEIDVRPFAALFRKKSLKEQVHADGINSGDSERVTNGAIGRGTSALNQNAVLIAEANDVPDDQKVSGKARFAISLSSRSSWLRTLSVIGWYRLRAPSHVRAYRNESIVSPAGTG